MRLSNDTHESIWEILKDSLMNLLDVLKVCGLQDDNTVLPKERTPIKSMELQEQ